MLMYVLLVWPYHTLLLYSSLSLIKLALTFAVVPSVKSYDTDFNLVLLPIMCPQIGQENQGKQQIVLG